MSMRAHKISLKDRQIIYTTYITIVISDETPKVPFPWSAFLSQPVFHPKYKLILNPQKFQEIYHVRLLESCLRQSLANKYRRSPG
jgi:hypothetical protein